MNSSSAHHARAATARPSASEAARPPCRRPPRAPAPRVRRDSVSAAVDYLRASVIGGTQGAVDVLREYKGRLDYLALYAEFFPAQFRASKAPCLPSARERADYRYNCGDEGWPHSEREVEFFHLVDAHLFPLPLWLLDDMAEMWAKVPNMGERSDWEDDDPDDFDTAQQLAGALINPAWHTPEEVAASLGRPVPLFDPQPEQRQPSGEALRKVFGAQAEPLKHFADAWAVMSGNTSNAHIDPQCLCGSCDVYRWTSEDLTYLAEQYVEKGEIIARVRLLGTWLGKSPRKRIAQVIKLWNHAAEITPERSR